MTISRRWWRSGRTPAGVASRPPASCCAMPRPSRGASGAGTVTCPISSFRRCKHFFSSCFLIYFSRSDKLRISAQVVPDWSVYASLLAGVQSRAYFLPEADQPLWPSSLASPFSIFAPFIRSQRSNSNYNVSIAEWMPVSTSGN